MNAYVSRIWSVVLVEESVSENDAMTHLERRRRRRQKRVDDYERLGSDYDGEYPLGVPLEHLGH